MAVLRFSLQNPTVPSLLPQNSTLSESLYQSFEVNTALHVEFGRCKLCRNLPDFNNKRCKKNNGYRCNHYIYFTTITYMGKDRDSERVCNRIQYDRELERKRMRYREGEKTSRIVLENEVLWIFTSTFPCHFHIRIL